MASLTTLDYPASLGDQATAGQHYVLIDSYKSLNAITKNDKRISSIALYIPPNSLKFTHNATYNNDPGGALKAASFSGALQAAQNGGGDSGAGGDLLSSITATFGSIVAASIPPSTFGSIVEGGKAAAQGVGAKLSDKAGFAAATGIATNNHLSLTYQGPSEFRSHDFVFDFWPKSSSEAITVQTIMRDFEQGMLPRVSDAKVNSRTLSAAFFHAPRHYKITFCKGGLSRKGNRNTNLFKIKTSVITSMTVNHDPESIVSLHKDGYPVHSRLSLSFKEIELSTSLDSVDSNITSSIERAESNFQQRNEARSRATEQQDLTNDLTGG